MQIASPTDFAPLHSFLRGLVDAPLPKRFQVDLVDAVRTIWNREAVEHTVVFQIFVTMAILPVENILHKPVHGLPMAFAV